jgi:hypothetical protein
MKFWESPRKRKRVLRWSALVLILPIAWLAWHFSTPGNPRNANGPEIPNYVQPTRSPFTAAEKEAVHPVLADFIRNAVARDSGGDVAKAWDVAGPDLREGLSRREWDRGDIPVVPYPASNHGLGEWSYVKYSYTDTVGLEVFVFPQPGSGYSAMTADAEVYKDKNGKWYVNYWLPEKFHGPPALTAAQKKAEQKAAKAAAAAAAKKPKGTRVAAPATPNPDAARARGLWWAVPIGIVSLIIFGPIVAMLVIWLRNKREQRRFMRSA